MRRACLESEQTGMHFLGPTVLGIAATVFSARDEQDRALERATELLTAECPCHNHLWLHRDAISVFLDRGEWDRAARHVDMLEQYASRTRVTWATYHVRKGRLVTALRNRRPDRAERADIRALLDTSRERGLAGEWPLLERLLDRM